MSLHAARDRYRLGEIAMTSRLDNGEKSEFPAAQRRARQAASDPWQVAGEAHTSVQGIWLLSYLDVMTILFTFFVLLFAYQKAMTAIDVKPAAMTTARAEPRAFPADSLAPTQRPSETPAVVNVPAPAESENAAESLISAVAVMKSQVELREVARDFTAEREAPEPGRVDMKPMPLMPVWQTMARLGGKVSPDATASEQTAKQLANLLANEAAKKHVDIIRAPHEVRLELSDAILFDRARAVLRAEGVALLDRLTPVLARQTGIVSIEGHTDPTPIANTQFPSNWELSSARATAVTRHLIHKGIPADRLRAVGMADTQPKGSNGTAAGRATNRRVSLVIHLEESNSVPSPNP